MKNKIRIAIAGYGVVGKKRKKILDKISNVEIVGISDIDRKNNIFSNKIKFFTNYNDLFKMHIDAIFISLPNKFAADATIKAFNKKINVFCEKPPARNYLEFKKVIRVYEKSKNLIVKYGFNHRYHDSVVIAKKILDSKKYGKIINVKGIYGKSKIISFTGQWRSKKSIAGGGILLDQGIHLLDIIRFFCGNFVEIKSFISNNFWKHNVEDNAYAIMRTKNKIVAMIHSTATQWQHQFRLEITLEKAIIVLSGILSSSKTYGQEKIEVQLKNSSNKRNRTLKFNKDLSWKREVTEYINCLKKRKKIANGNIYDAEEVMKMVDQIYKSDKI